MHNKDSWDDQKTQFHRLIVMSPILSWNAFLREVLHVDSR